MAAEQAREAADEDLQRTHPLATGNAAEATGGSDVPPCTLSIPGVVTTEWNTCDTVWSNRDPVVVVIVVVDADVATDRTSAVVPDPITKYVPTGMFAIPPDATVHDVVPAVAADADAVADAVPADQFEHVKTVPDAGDRSIAAFGGSGIPVFGVHADKPTNRVWVGDSFCRRHAGFTPVPVGAMNTATGSGVVLVIGTGPPLSFSSLRVSDRRRRRSAHPRLMFRPPAGDAAANPNRMVVFGTCPCRTSCCPDGTAKLTVVEALQTRCRREMKHVLDAAVGLVHTTRSRL